MTREFILDDYEPEPSTPADSVPLQRKPPPPKYAFGPDWLPTLLESIEDCDEARLRLVQSISTIEAQISNAEERRRQTREYADANWYRRAKSALRFKRMALQMVQERRGALNKQERRVVGRADNNLLLDLLHELQPEIMAQLLVEARKRYPGRFD